MSICNKCYVELDDRNYCAEGMCKDCYYDYINEQESKLNQEEEDQISKLLDLLDKGEDLDD